MKLQIISTLVFLFVTQTALAAVKEIQSCSPKQLQALNKTIADQKADGLVHVKLMKNAKKEIVGFYAWEKSGEESMSAEICESFGDSDVTIASEWFYWDGNADPSVFQKDKTYEMSQDEGIARLKILETSKVGNITAEFSVLGWGEDSEPTVVRRSIVTFEDFK